MKHSVGIFSIWKCELGYFIGYKDYMYDNDMIKAIKIPKEDYIKILQSYNARFDAGEYFFDDMLNAIKCAEFLNEKYGLLIVLLEGVE